MIRMKKRGQITIILVVAVILIIAGLGFIFLNKQLKNNEPEKKDMANIQGPIQSYAESCLSNALESGLDLLGSQGGVIFESQQGKTPDSMKYLRRIYDLNGEYIFAPLDTRMNGRMTCQPYIEGYYQPWLCPSEAFPFKSKDSGVLDFDEKAELPGNIRIMNRLFFHGLFETTDDVFFNTDWKKSVRNVYSSLKSYMEFNVNSCLDFSNIKLSTGITVEPMGKLEIFPVFSEKGTSAMMQYQVKASDSEGSFTVLSKFYAQSQKKFFSIYKFLYFTLREEASNFTYNLSAHQPSELGDDDLFIEMQEDIKGKDDLLTVYQMVNGNKIYNYRQMIYNSPPAMSYIHYANLDAVKGVRDSLPTCVLYPPLESPFAYDSNNPDAYKNYITFDVGMTFNETSIGCIYLAYNKTVDNYLPYVDPEGDTAQPSYKFGNCGWNEPCKMAGEELSNIYPTAKFIIKWDDGEYADFQNMTVYLLDHAPNAIEQFGPKIIKEIEGYPVGCTISIRVMDVDIKFGQEVDEITASFSPTPGDGGISILDAPGDSWAIWNLDYNNFNCPSSITVTAKDRYGKELTETINV